MRLARNDLGTEQRLDSAKIRQTLGWSPRGLEEMTIAAVDLMITYGVVKSPTM